MSRILLALLTATTLAPAAHAAVTVLDFNELRKPNGSTAYVYGHYEHDGYRLTAGTCTSSNSCFTTTGTALNGLDRIGAALQTHVATRPITLTAIDGSYFRLTDIDLAYRWGNSSGYGPTTMNVLFAFTFADGTILEQTRELAITAGEYLTVNHLSFDLGQLRSVTLTPNRDLQFDNIRLVTGAVPEPATWAMLIAGFGLVGASLRRRRPAAA